MSTYTNYIIKVKTSDIRYAGTDANVCLQLFGEQGISDTFHLKKSNCPNKFERNQTDEFKFFGVEQIGTLERLKVWHDNKGTMADWHLEYIEVSDTGIGKMYRFPCHSWIGGDNGCMATVRCMETTDGPKFVEQVALGIPNPNPPPRKRSLTGQLSALIRTSGIDSS